MTLVLEGGCPDFLLPPLRLGWRREGEAWWVLISPSAISAGHCPLQGQLCPAGVPTTPFLSYHADLSRSHFQSHRAWGLTLGQGNRSLPEASVGGLGRTSSSFGLLFPYSERLR